MRCLIFSSLFVCLPILSFGAPERLELWPGEAPVSEGVAELENAFITVFHPDKPNGAAFVICPGGGYSTLVKGPEGTGIAEWLNGQGIVGIVLEYRLPEGRPYVPLYDAQRAIRTVRFKAPEWHINPQQIGIMGFSAGGHLAATSATHFDLGNSEAEDPLEHHSCRPDFAVLVYPAIVIDSKSHAGVKKNLLGENPSSELQSLFSVERWVSDTSPPVFLAHAADDTVVPSRNSEVFFETLRGHGVQAFYLELPKGGHGLNWYKGPMWDAWQNQSLQWLTTQGLICLTDKTNKRGN